MVCSEAQPPFITPGDLESDLTVKRSLTDAGAKTSRTVGAGATLVCCIGATIGKVSMTTVCSAFNQQINAVEWGEGVNAQVEFAEATRALTHSGRPPMMKLTASLMSRLIDSGATFRDGQANASC